MQSTLCTPQRPLLFNVFFAAVLHIALERFSRNADILGDLVHLDESPKGMEPETALNIVMRAVWGMLYADDACLVSRSPQGIAKMMSVSVEVFGACGLTVSEKKTEVMTMPPPRAVCCTPTMPALYRDHRKVLRK